MRKLNITNKKVPRKDKRIAQGIVEFALVLPILLLLVFGIIEFGRLLFMYAAVTSSSREGARYGAAVGELPGVTHRYQDCAGIQASATRIGSIVGVSAADIVIQYTKYLDDGSTQTLTGCPPSSPIRLADRIIVTVTRNFQPIVPLVNIPPVPISSTTARTIIKDVDIEGTPAPTATFIGDTLTPTPTETPTDTPTDTPTSEYTPTDTPTASDTPTPSDTPTSTSTYTPGPSPTSTPTGTPTDTPTETPTDTPTPTATPVPPCDPANYSIVEPMQPDIDERLAFYSVYFRIRNNSGGNLTITNLTFDWPPPFGQGSEMPLSEIRFADRTEPNRSCGPGTTCIWDGWNSTVSYTTITACTTGCPEIFDGSLADRQLVAGDEKDLKFVFGEELNSSINPAYNPNPFPYRARVVFDNSCYVETLLTQYLHP